jgi:hypothetical protein
VNIEKMVKKEDVAKFVDNGSEALDKEAYN